MRTGIKRSGIKRSGIRLASILVLVLIVSIGTANTMNEGSQNELNRITQAGGHYELISIKDNKFIPETTYVKQGVSVFLLNEDSLTHYVRFSDVDGYFDIQPGTILSGCCGVQNVGTIIEYQDRDYPSTKGRTIVTNGEMPYTDETATPMPTPIPIQVVTPTPVVTPIPTPIPIQVVTPIPTPIPIQVVTPIAYTPMPTPVPTPIPIHVVTPDIGITYDGINLKHAISLCSPVPIDNYQYRMISTYNCGTYTYSLSNYPLDDLPSGGNSMRVSPSEMVIVQVSIWDDYTNPGKIIYTWYQKAEGGSGSDRQLYQKSYDIDTCGGGFGFVLFGECAVFSVVNPQSYIGRFSWEITQTGMYYVVVDTTWGSERIDFQVTE